MKCFLLILHFSLLLFHTSIALAIEVGGHLTEDTVWSPDNNPYLVTENLYVDSGVTLTILPGTEIKVSGAVLSNYGDSDDNFWLYNGDSVAKMIWVNGRIIAEGTEQDSITFDRMQQDIYYNWGSIYIAQNAELSVFKHCKIQNANGIWIAVSVPTKGLSFANGKGIVNKCTFINNAASIYSSSYTIELEITDNDFIINENVNPFYPNYNYGRRFIHSGSYSDDPTQKTLVCNNRFYGIPSYICTSAKYLSFYNNTVMNSLSISGFGHYYKNEFNNCYRGIWPNDDDSLYIKSNRFIGGYKGIDINRAYVEISDNYFEGCGLYSEVNVTGKVHNNYALNGRIQVPGFLEVFNNISAYGNNVGIEASWRNISCHNNLAIGNEYAIGSGGTLTYDNSIIIMNNALNQYSLSGNPIFRNCILDFPLDPPLIDGGGNIWVDSLQVQQIFEDFENGNFRLASGSIAIDAGFDTLGYYYPFDMDYSARVWDGSGDGNAIIDIGPYEYCAPQLGKISGYITETESAAPVHYVLLKIDNEPGNFTFADSMGYYEIQLPNGTYDIYAERVFYEDNVIYSVTVENEQITEVNFNMTSTLQQVGINQEVLNIHHSTFKINNYPNPFNPSTTIAFSNERFEQNEQITLEIYNIKGQKIRQFNIQNSKFKINEVVWDGKDEGNRPVSSGVYLYKLSSGKDTVTHKMLLLK